MSLFLRLRFFVGCMFAISLSFSHRNGSIFYAAASPGQPIYCRFAAPLAERTSDPASKLHRRTDCRSAVSCRRVCAAARPVRCNGLLGSLPLSKSVRASIPGHAIQDPWRSSAALAATARHRS